MTLGPADGDGVGTSLAQDLIENVPEVPIGLQTPRTPSVMSAALNRVRFNHRRIVIDLNMYRIWSKHGQYDGGDLLPGAG